MPEQKWVSEDALRIALKELRQREIVGNPAIAFLAQKRVGLNATNYVDYISQAEGGQKQLFFLPYLKVADGEQSARYYLPFDGTITPGGASDYSHSSVYSPWRELRKDYIRLTIEWQDGDGGDRSYKARYLPGYEGALKAKLFAKTDGMKRIPLAALAIYLQAKEGAVPGDASLDDLIASWISKLHLTDAEVSALFDMDVASIPGEPFTLEERPEEAVNRTIIEQAAGSMRRAPVAGQESREHADERWDDVQDVPMTLVGMESSTQQALAALEAGKHVVLIGPPGCGKTMLAETLCQGAKAAGLIQGYRMATATAEWTTFETIGGYMPDRDDSSRLAFQQGLVTESLAKGDWLVLDELNRADFDKAFGELFTLLSGNPAWLPFKNASGQRYAIAPHGVDTEDAEAIEAASSWRIIATMNTADKSSLFQFSYALMRRFAFVTVSIPGEEAYGALIETFWQAHHQLASKSHLLGHVRDLLASESKGFTRGGVRVGPAIAKDMIAYLAARFSDGAVFDGKDEASLLESVEMYALPQMEGMDAQHEALLSAIVDALELSEAGRQRLDAALAVWTGYQPF